MPKLHGDLSHEVLQFAREASEQIGMALPSDYSVCRTVCAQAAITMAEAILMSAYENKKLDDKKKQLTMQNGLNTLQRQSVVLDEDLRAQLHPAVLAQAMSLMLAP